MINLIPYDYKEQIIYGRRNKVLIKWIVAMAVAMAVIAAVSIAGILFMHKTTVDYKKTVDLNKEQLTSQNTEQSYKELETLSKNFKTVTDIASQQLLYSKLIQKIAPLLPSDTTINGIDLAQGEYSLDLIVNGPSDKSVTQAFVNISSKENGIFEKADLLSVNCKSGDANSNNTSNSSDEAPCKASIKGLLAKDSSLYYINSKQGKQ